MEQERFVKLPYALMKAKGFVNKDGEVIPLTHAEKIIYLYLKDRVQYFVHERKEEYFESQETIADNINVNRATVGRTVTKFRDNGILFAVSKKGVSKYNNLSYTSIKDLILFPLDKNKGSYKAPISCAEEFNIESLF